MRQEAIGRWVVGLYPPEIRDRVGAELVGTLLDAGDASNAAYVRQLFSLVRSGVSARARAELRRPIGQVAVSTLGWVAVFSAMSHRAIVIAIRLRWNDAPGSDPETIVHYYVLPVLILCLFTLRRHRSVGALGLMWLALFLHQHSKLPLAIFCETVPLQAVGFALLVARPRTPVDGRYLWPVPAAAWVFFQLEVAR